MSDLINQSTIWKFVGCVSAANGLICFALSSTYHMTFGQLGFGGLLVYLLVCLIMSYLITVANRIQVSEKLQGVVAALIFVVICLISILHDKLVTRKSDALSIISYGSFALMSISMSRKFELGFEIGFSAFFLQLFAAQLFKINWILLPIALIFCFAILLLRHYSESGVQFGSITQNGYHPVEVGLSNAALIEIGDDEDSNDESQDVPGMGQVSRQSLLSTNYDQQNNQEESSQAMHHSPSNGEVSEEIILRILDWDNEQNNEQEQTGSSFPASQYSPGMREVSGQSLSPTNDEQNNQEESSQATHHSPSSGEVSEGSVLDGDSEQNNEQEEDRSSLAAESSNQDHVSSGNNTLSIQSSSMHISGEPELSSLAPPRELRRLREQKKEISHRKGATLIGVALKVMFELPRMIREMIDKKRRSKLMILCSTLKDMPSLDDIPREKLENLMIQVKEAADELDRKFSERPGSIGKWLLFNWSAKNRRVRHVNKALKRIREFHGRKSKEN